jgi:hypothetical protein
MALDASNQLWGVTSTDSPTSPNSLVKIDPGSALVTVVAPVTVPSGGTTAGMEFLPSGTLIGWFTGPNAYGTINTTTGQVTLLTGSGVLIGGLVVSRTNVIIGPDTYAPGTVVAVTSTSQSPNANLRVFNTSTNTDSAILSLSNLPCCFLTSLEISSTGTIFGLAGGSLVSIPPLGIAAVLGAVPANVDTIAFAPTVSVSVTVTPPVATLGNGQSQQFTATVTGTANTAVTWSIPPGSPGTISATGLYTAPNPVPSQSVTITATSQADTTKSGTASVNLSPTLSTVPAPPSLLLAAVGLGLLALFAASRRLSIGQR